MSIKSKYTGETCYEFSCPSYECTKPNPYYDKSDGGGKEDSKSKEVQVIQKK